MALQLKLQPKLTQQLVMTPQLRQAIKLLQLSHLELVDVLHEEMEQNPLLEEGDGDDVRDEESDGALLEVLEHNLDALEGAEETAPSMEESPNDDARDEEQSWDKYAETESGLGDTRVSGSALAQGDTNGFESMLTQAATLQDHIAWQLRMLGLSDIEYRIAEMLVDGMDSDGYLPQDIVDHVRGALDCSHDEVENVITLVQACEPIGVGARDMRECLLIQLNFLGKEGTLAWRIVQDYLGYVEKRELGGIADVLGVGLEDVQCALRVIASLEPKPGASLSQEEPQYIAPDIYIYKVGSDYVVYVNDEGIPNIRISPDYKHSLNAKSTSEEDKSYLNDKLRNATWLIRSIHMRNRTIFRVTESILKFQMDFFEKGPAHLKPLVLKDVAEDVGMHESTISRVTTNKYVHTPRGMFELKYFFNSSIRRQGVEDIASESVRERIKAVIEAEDLSDPVSDQQLVGILGQSGIKIARRTVAKYREMMKIPPSSHRKKMF